MTDIDHKGQMGEFDFGRSLFQLGERQEPLTHPRDDVAIYEIIGKYMI